MGLDEGEEELVDAGVGGEFGVEGGGEEMALADENGGGIAGGEDLDGGAGFGDAGGADEDHFKRRAGQGSGGEEDGGVDLAAVGVALDGDVEDAERGLGRVADVAREQDDAGAGAEGGGLADKGVEDVEEAVALQVAQEGGGLAAGEDEAVEVCELGGAADKRGLGPGGDEGLGVSLVGSLES